LSFIKKIKKDFNKKQAKKGFSFWNSYDGLFVRWQVLKGMFLFVILLIFAIVMKVKMDRCNRMCEGPDCVEVVASFSEQVNYVPDVDDRKYQEIYFFKDNSKKPTYIKVFNSRNETIVSVEKENIILRHKMVNIMREL